MDHAIKLAPLELMLILFRINVNNANKTALVVINNMDMIQ